MKIFGIEFGKTEKSEMVELPEKIDTSMAFEYVYKPTGSLNTRGSGDLGDPYIEFYRGSGPVYFGQDNLYPQHLNDMYNRSALHSAIVDFKKELISGEGYEIEGIDSLDASQKIRLKQFQDFVDGERTLQKFIDDITFDYLIHGTIYNKLYWNSDKSKLLKVKRIDPAKMRVGTSKTDYESVNKYYYCFEWSEYGRFGWVELPPFDMTSDEKIDILRSTIPSTLNWYCLPSYSSAANWINLDGDISLYHKSNIENSINPSMAIKYPEKPGSEEERRRILLNLKKQAQGAKNAGRSLIFFADGKDNLPEIETIQVSNIDKQFNVTSDHIQRNICYAHKINPLILGLKTPGSLGNGAELDYAFDIFKEGVIKPAKKDIEEHINKLLSLKGLNVKIKLNEKQFNIKNDTQK